MTKTFFFNRYFSKHKNNECFLVLQARKKKKQHEQMQKLKSPKNFDRLSEMLSKGLYKYRAMQKNNALMKIIIHIKIICTCNIIYNAYKKY